MRIKTILSLTARMGVVILIFYWFLGQTELIKVGVSKGWNNQWTRKYQSHETIRHN